jgi:hypothetical protein
MIFHVVEKFYVFPLLTLFFRNMQQTIAPLLHTFIIDSILCKSHVDEPWSYQTEELLGIYVYIKALINRL